MNLPKVFNYGRYSSDNYGAHTLAFETPNGVFYFSYDTMVAFRGKTGLHVIKNYWGTTTGKHLNWIDGGRKENREDKESFKKNFALCFGAEMEIE